MNLDSIEIENFRSISSKITLHEKQSKFISIVGPNNIGKSNILRAINLFFNEEVEPGVKFDPLVDINQSANSAKIAVVFRFDKSNDRAITSYIDKHHSEEFKDYTISVTLALSAAGRADYSFSAGRGQRKNLPGLKERITEYVNCVYIPAIKDYRTLIDSEMMRKIVAATFQGWGKGLKGSRTIGEQKEKFKKLLGEIQGVLDESGDYVSAIIHSVVPNIEKFSFSLPYDNLEDFLGRLLFRIKESDLEEPVTLANVGSGVQSFTIFSMLRLLHEIRPTNTYKKSRFIWLIEEPETFLHHDLQKKLFAKLKEYSSSGHILITTHSPVFIHKDRFGDSYVVERTPNACVRPITPKALLGVIAGNLGVSFDDFLDFKRFNVLVEGESDKNILLGLNERYRENGKRIIDIDNVGLIVCGSASSIPHFWNVYNVFNQYADFIALFDRDEAGVKARGDMLARGIAAERLLLIPESEHQPDCEIEDLVDRSTWECVVNKLDADGLVTLNKKQGKLMNYEYEPKNRTDVKVRFAKYLLEAADLDLAAFKTYEKLLKSIAAAAALTKRVAS